jgi:Resolvase, N terminal domain.
MNASPFKAGDKVVAYCRYSEGDEQGLHNTSTEEQADAIRAFCEANQLILVRVFADPFASGRSIAKRDHYLEMLSFLLHKKKPDIQGVVLWDFERYGRNYDQAQLDAARLRIAGYKLFSLQQPITDDGPFAHVLEAMYFASAQNQSDMISADVKRALQHNFTAYKVIPRSSIGWGWKPEPVDMGLFSDGSSRIGYRSVPDPEKADHIREAIEARLRGASFSQCRQILGAPNNLDVKRLFRKIQLYGAYSYGDTIIEDYCEPIISKEKFDELQLFEKSHPGRQIGRQGGWSADPPMLSGLLYCAECGKPMYIYRRKSKGHLYCAYYCENTCFKGVKQEIIEPLIIRLCGEILTPSNIRGWVDQLINGNDSEVLEAYRQTTEKDLAAIEKKISNAVSLLLDHPSEALTAKLQELEAKRKVLQSRLKSLTERSTVAINPDTLYNSTLELSNVILDVLRSPTKSADSKRSVLATFIRSIVIDKKGNVIINYLPPGFAPKVVTQSDSALPSEEEKMGGVVTQSAHNPVAPPDEALFRLQHFGSLFDIRRDQLCLF